MKKIIPIILLLVFTVPVLAGEAEDIGAYTLDNMFLFFSAVLVLFMQQGFALVEAGLNIAKNTVNILFKNLIDLCIGVLVYFGIDYSLMYGSSYLNGFIGFAGFGISPAALHDR